MHGNLLANFADFSAVPAFIDGTARVPCLEDLYGGGVLSLLAAVLGIRRWGGILVAAPFRAGASLIVDASLIADASLIVDDGG